MSHITKVKVSITDLDALAEACIALGGELKLDVKKYMMYGNQKVDCFATIKFAGVPYEIGVQQQKDGTYALEADFWGSGGLTQKVGKDAVMLDQQYKSAVVKKEMKKKGFRVSKSWEENGTITHEFEKTMTGRSWG